MEHSSEVFDMPWVRVLETMPIPAAVLDRQGHYLYLNTACALDAVFSRIQVGNGAPEPVGNDGMDRRIRQRHAYYEQVVQTHTPLYFTEEVEGGSRRLWLCVPVMGPDDDVCAVLVLVFDTTSLYREMVTETTQEFKGRIEREIQIPLIAFVGLTDSLAYALGGEQTERVAQLELSGKLLLRQLRAMLDSSPV